MKKFRLASSILMVVLLCASLGCGSQNSNDSVKAETKETSVEAKEVSEKETSVESKESVSTKKVRVAFFQTSVYDSAFYIAHEKGLFEKRGIEVEISNFANGPAVNEAFLAGEVDVVNGIGDQPVLISWTKGVETELFAATSAVTGATLLTNDLSLSTVEELKGKRIGVGIGTNKHKSVLEILGDVGLGQDDVELVNIDGDDSGIAALSRGEIDAYMFKRPSAEAEVVKAGEGKVLADLSQHPSYSWLVARTEWVEENKETFQEFVDALYEAQLWFEDNLEEGYQLIANLSELDAETVKGFLSGGYSDLSLSEEEKNAIHNTYNFLVNTGSITNEISSEEIDSHLNSEFIEDAKKRIKK